ncbi:hypothetical protein F5888DRAFT_1716809 [Russula emetica]|nr:hypothetical protein F5888DRAFT_1716809 [Russula emetica]
MPRTRVLIRQLNFFSPTTRTRLPQQASTDDSMPTPTRIPLSTQRTSTNEQHHQASNNAALNEDRIGIESSHRHRLGGLVALLYRVASEIEMPHAGPGRQVKVGSAAQQEQQHQTPCASDHASHTKTNNNGAATTTVPSQVVQVRMRAPFNINMNTLHQQVRHPHHRPHHSRYHHQIGARSILPQILRSARSRYQRRRLRPGAN